ncbi:MAG: hypothetical protein ACTSPB_04545 [Candidatus Thorarchaeota archaeon]
MKLTSQQTTLLAIVLVFSFYSLIELTYPITGFTVISNTSGEAELAANATVSTFCQVHVSARQSGTDYITFLDGINFGSLYSVGAMGTPQRVVLSANTSSNARINVTINGTDWSCMSGTCTGGEDVTGQNVSMSVGITHYLNETADPGNTTIDSTSIDTGSEWASAYILQKDTNVYIRPRLNISSYWTNMTFWLNVQAPDNTSAGNYTQNITFGWSCTNSVP